MLLPFRLGGGGVLGSGRQYWSWITRTDLVRAIHHCLITDGLRGPVNAVAPAPVTNKEFTKALGRVLNRPTLVPMPAFAARLAFGEMADALMLGSTRVIPEKLGETGFAFQAADIIAGLREALAD
jgi:NAD dependent epimerase/dehydratase family enzyme